MTLAIALALTVMTGFSGLVYEVTWQKYLAILLGSHSEATSTVLAIFLGGLSIGYALFGRITQWQVNRARESGRPLHLLRFYAVIEASIGVYAALFPTFFQIARRVSLLVPTEHTGLAFGFDVILAAVLIGPASVLMGGTIPILTLALTRHLDQATRIHAWIYGLNTFGAFAGALLGGFLLIPMLGLNAVLYSMAVVNLVAAAGFLLLDRNLLLDLENNPQLAQEEVVEAESSAPSSGRISGIRGLLAVSALAGFAMMSIQTILIRTGSLALGASMFTFAMVVAVFVLAIALGSLLVSFFERIPPLVIVGSQWLLFGLLVLLYQYLPDSPYYAHVARAFFRDTAAAFYPYQLLLFASLLALLIVPIGLSGALLPLLFHHLRRTRADLGSIAGQLYSWNTVGSLLGALLGGYVLLIWLDLHHVYRIALAAICISAAILTAQVLGFKLRSIAILLIAPLLGGLWMLDPWDPERIAAGLFRLRAPNINTYLGADEFFMKVPSHIIFSSDGPSATVTVREDKPKGEKVWRSISTNGKSDGHLVADYPTMALAALVPSLLADSPQRSFVIGFGTGITAGELASIDQMREVHVAEISQAVLDAAPLFEEGNRGALGNRKVEIHRGDAYRALLRTTGTYDVIVSEPSNPWVNGVEMLYSREFLEAARDRLSPGGVYTQWFHQYEANDEAVALVLRTYAKVFPYVSIWFTAGTDLLIMGFNDASRPLDVAALRNRFRQPDFRAGFERVGIRRFSALLAHELIPLGVLNSVELPGELHTLLHPRLSYQAARGFFVGEDASLPTFLRPQSLAVAKNNSLLRRFSGEGVMPERILAQAASEVCRRKRNQLCSTLLSLWQHSYPESDGLKQTLEHGRSLPRLASELTPSKLEDLSRFFDREAVFERRKRPLMATAKLSRMYAEYFHYPIPFEHRALVELWQMCDTPSCDLERANFQEILGPLDPL